MDNSTESVLKGIFWKQLGDCSCLVGHRKSHQLKPKWAAAHNLFRTLCVPTASVQICHSSVFAWFSLELVALGSHCSSHNYFVRAAATHSHEPRLFAGLASSVTGQPPGTSCMRQFQTTGRRFRPSWPCACGSLRTIRLWNRGCSVRWCSEIPER